MALKNLLHTGSQGNAVIQLQTYLNQLSLSSLVLKVDGDFGSKTETAVKNFQGFAKLTVDGIVGNNTWNALLKAIEEIPSDEPSMNNVPPPQAALADIAARYIGVTETDDNLAGNDPLLKEIFEADNLTIDGKTDGYPWCAAFVSLCVQKLIQQSECYNNTALPKEASVSRFLSNWARLNGCLIFNPDSNSLKPEKGDIVVFTFSHIGIVESVRPREVSIIEGNTNEAGSREGKLVARKHRALSLIKSFIRLPVHNDELSTKSGETVVAN